MKRETAKRLHDAISACDELQRIGENHTRAQFLDDRILKLAVWKLVEIIGEALRQGEASDHSLRTRIPELRDVVDTRNRITHGYDSVDFGLLWDIVQDEIPPLKARMADLLGDSPKPGSPSTSLGDL